MDLAAFNSILYFIQNSSYLWIFILIFLEGPIATAAAAFAASSGYLNIYIILFLSILGNLVPDTLLYFFGRFARRQKIEGYIKKFGLNEQRINEFETGFKNHAIKTIIFAKVTPLLALPGLILAGFAKIDFKKYFLICFIFNITSTLIFAGLGYYLGIASIVLFKYLKIGEYALLALIPVIFVLYFLMKRLFLSVSKKYA